MPRFFFNLHDDGMLIDEEGAELPTADAARSLAVRVARELASQQVLDGRLVLSHSVEVEDQNRRSILVLPFGNAVKVEE